MRKEDKSQTSNGPVNNHEAPLNPKIAFGEVYSKAKKMGLSGAHMAKIESLEFIQVPKSSGIGWLTAALITIIALLLGLQFHDYAFSPRETIFNAYSYFAGVNLDDACLLDAQSEVLNDIFRPIADCDVCSDLTAIDKVSKITPEEFEERYAYSKVPVVIVDGAQDWPAKRVFSFEYFKDLYAPGSTALDNAETKCQFFPYDTDFDTLGELFGMDDKRAKMIQGAKPWYVGWSNCDPLAAAELRRHYTRPYFLPRQAESSKTDWIFMGSVGYGAPMHVDNVNHPSWQAQIRGHKLWTLKPPLECTYQCPTLQVTVHPGEIIVLDTNTWYHSTLIKGEEMSITIGSEFD